MPARAAVSVSTAAGGDALRRVGRHLRAVLGQRDEDACTPVGSCRCRSKTRRKHAKIVKNEQKNNQQRERTEQTRKSRSENKSKNTSRNKRKNKRKSSCQAEEGTAGGAPQLIAMAPVKCGKWPRTRNNQGGWQM